MTHGWSERFGGTAHAPGETDPWLSDVLLLTAVVPSRTEMRRARRLLRVSGVLALLAGALAIAVPAAASVTIAVFIGWMLVFAGVVMLVHAFSIRARRLMAVRLVNAMLALLVGIGILVFPLTGTVTLTFMLAVWFFGSGMLQLAIALWLRGRPGAGLVALDGTVSLLLGVLIAASLPSSGGWAIGLLVGVNLIFWGVRALLAASRLQTPRGV
ncbi:MAG: HdeD family acid-resistance protein [Gaiellaceae bacterium]